MTVKEHLEQTYEPNNKYTVRKAIKCVDGFTLSVQGGTHTHYCTPREHCNYYVEVECGYPSSKEELLMPYAEDESNPTKTVYGYVPIEVVEQIVIKHGGIISKDT